MIYIKIASKRNVLLGGQIASQAMLDDGWIEYNGEVPSREDGQLFEIIDGVLVAYTPEVAPLTQVQIYKDYLNATDFKMLPSYVPKEGEDINAVIAKRNVAREYIRENDTTSVIVPPTANTP